MKEIMGPVGPLTPNYISNTGILTKYIYHVFSVFSISKCEVDSLKFSVLWKYSLSQHNISETKHMSFTEL